MGRRSRASMRSSTSSTCQPRRRPEFARERRLAGGHEPDQVDLVRPHRRSLSSVSKNPGYEIATDSAPRITRIALGAERGNGEGHRQAVVARRVGRPARETARAAQRGTRPANSSTSRAERPQPRHERRDAVALLDAELAGPAHRKPAPEGRQRGQRREFVDEAGHLGRAGSPRAEACRASPSRCHAARRRRRRRPARSTLAPIRSQDAEERRARRVHAHALEHRRPPPGMPGRRRRPERGRRRVAGHGDVGRRAAPGRRRPRCARRSTPMSAPNGGQRPLGVIARLLRLGHDRVTPSAWRPASSTALFTCALGTGVEYAIAVQRRRRAPSPAGSPSVGVDAGAHAVQRLHHAPHRPAAERVVTGQGAR